MKRKEKPTGRWQAINTHLRKQVFVDSAYKELTDALSPAPNLLRPNNLSGDLTDDCVNNFMSFFEEIS